MLEQTCVLIEQALADVGSGSGSGIETGVNPSTVPIPNLETSELATVLLALQDRLASDPIPQPHDHTGDPRVDLFALELTDPQVRAIHACVVQAVATDTRTAATAQRGLGGFIAAWLEYLRACGSNGAEQPNHESSKGGTVSNQDVVKELIEGFNAIDLERIVGCFADDAIYHNMPMQPVQGTQAIRAGLAPFLQDATRVQWDLLSIAENAQGHVLTERLDKFEIGGRWIEVAVMGIFEVVDGRIHAWRDYFDLAQFQQQMAG